MRNMLKGLFVTLMITIYSTITGQVIQTNTPLSDMQQQAQQEQKVIVVELLNHANQTTSALNALTNDDLILLSSNPNANDFDQLAETYKVKHFPAYIFMSAKGMLLLDVDQTSDPSKLQANAQKALVVNQNTETSVDVQTLTPDQLYAYIERRTGLDNADLIDKYFTINRSSLSPKELQLFLNHHCINFGGEVFHYIQKHQSKVAREMNINQKDLQALLIPCIEKSFKKACANKNEVLVNQLIDYQIGQNKNLDPRIIKYEYQTRYYYQTRQALKLSQQAAEYVQILDQKKIETKTERIQEQEYAERLTQTARYIVESVSNRSMLNSALQWSRIASNLFVSANNYETTAYILYKLGDRKEAIIKMEMAHQMPHKTIEQSSILAARLIKMKRGERIF